MATSAQVKRFAFSKLGKSASIESVDTDVSTVLSDYHGCSSQAFSALSSYQGSDSEGISSAYLGMVCGDSSMDLFMTADEMSEEISPPSPQEQAVERQSWMHDLQVSIRARLLGSKRFVKASNENGTTRCKKFLSVNERDVRNMYKISSAVMESTNKGVEVLFATRVRDGKEVVIKARQKCSSFKNLAEEQAWCRSMEYQLNMPRVRTICELFDVLETSECYYVVMEKAEGKDLCEHMTDRSLSHLDAQEVVRQILLALVAMHKAGRIHKDLKLENVMVDLNSSSGKARAELAAYISECPMSSADAKLIDFDTVATWHPNHPEETDIVGTDGYIAPEAYDGNYSPASDLYAVGAIMYFLLTGTWAFGRELFDDLPGENYAGSVAMKRVQQRLRTANIDFARSPFDRDPEAADLVARLLSNDPELRPSAAEALAHEWFYID
jgi:hypothetical protein